METMRQILETCGHSFRTEDHYRVKKLVPDHIRKKAIRVLGFYIPKSKILFDKAKIPFDRASIVYNTMWYFQRYVASVTSVQSDEDLLGYMTACISLALKLRTRTVDMTQVLPQIDLTEVKKMEEQILSQLTFKLYPLTPLLVMDDLKSLFPVTTAEYRVATKLILETTFDANFTGRKPSLIAMSALLVSTKTDSVENIALEHAFITVDELKECRDGMQAVYEMNAPKWDTEKETSTHDFHIDWLDDDQDNCRDPQLTWLHGTRHFVNFRSSRDKLIEIDPASRMKESLPIFEDVYSYLDEGAERFCVLRLDSCSKEDLEKFSKMTHPNIVRFHDLVCDDTCKLMTFEYSGRHLNDIKEDSMKPDVLKSLMYQLMSGIAHYHSILEQPHLHIRLESVLIFETCPLNIRIADFCPDKYSSKLGNRYDTYISYRAPELLLGTMETNASGRVEADIWAAGCIFGHFITGFHLFEGNNDDDRIKSIFRRLGTPTEENWPGALLEFSGLLEHYEPVVPKEAKDEFFSTKGVDVGEDGMKLLSEMLRLDPKQRITAEEALKSAFFKDFPSPPKEP